MICNIIVRPVKESDLEAVLTLALKSEDGLTTFPKSRKQLVLKIRKSIASFSSKVNEPFNEFYFFVMEDVLLKKIIGVCSITSSVGVEDPFFAFERQTIKKSSWCLQKEVSVDVLKLTRLQNGPSEIGTLFLDPDYRVKGLGRLLSLSRFSYIARFPHRFKSTIIAEMRGVINDDGSPFWNDVISHFFDIPFSEADQLSSQSKSFISELIPKYPIYINLLNKNVQDVIGRVHTYTKPALTMLLDEGFEMTKSIDIFDAGPKIEIDKEQLRFFKDLIKSETVTFVNQSEAVICDQLFCSGDESDFIVSLGYKNEEGLQIDQHLKKYCKETIYSASLYKTEQAQRKKLVIQTQEGSILERFQLWYSNLSSTLMVNG
jgi:arginine N-succinyltransferase